MKARTSFLFLLCSVTLLVLGAAAADAAVNVISNGDFELPFAGPDAEGDFVPPGWTKTTEVGPNIPSIGAVADNGPAATGAQAAHWVRVTGSNMGRQKHFVQALDVADAACRNPRLMLDVKVTAQQLEAGGWVTPAFEWPVRVTITYTLDYDPSTTQTWIHGFYITPPGDGPRKVDPGTGIIREYGDTQVTAGAWSTHTFDLAVALPHLGRIKQVAVGGSGWSFEAQVDNVVLEISPAGTWSDASDGPLADGGNGEGVVWADFDDDGDPDLYLSNTGPNRMLRNDHPVRAFADVTSGPLADGGNGRSPVAGDYDNDGDLDLYLVNSSGGPGGSSKLLRNDGAFTFADASSGPLGDQGQSAAWADYDLDGDLDIYVTDFGTGRLMRNDGAGVFATVANLGGWRAAAWGDYDNDGDPDLYAGGTGLFRNDGGTFINVTASPLGGGTEAVEWADYDNDGDLDLYLVTSFSANALMRNDGGGTFVNVTSGPLGHNSNDKDASWGDYDNDGDLDLVLVDNSGPEHLFRNEGNDVFIDDSPSPFPGDGINFSVAWADYNRDGDLDIYFQNQLTSRLVENNCAALGNHWLHIDLVGVVSNRSAIGARVRIKAGGIEQIREISAGSGGFSQNSLTVEFGMGSAAFAESLVVTWPSGIVQGSAAIPTDTRYTVVEGVQLGVDDGADPARGLALYPSYPNPFSNRSVVRFALPRAARVALAVYDVRGRRVRVLTSGQTFAAGRHEVVWDGATDRGDRAPVGVYYYAASVEGSLLTQRTVLLR